MTKIAMSKRDFVLGLRRFFLIGSIFLLQATPSYTFASPFLYECLAEMLCPGSDSSTSSTGLLNVGGKVMDTSEDKAVRQCLRVYRLQYEELLWQAYQNHCFLRPQVPSSL